VQRHIAAFIIPLMALTLLASCGVADQRAQLTPTIVMDAAVTTPAGTDAAQPATATVTRPASSVPTPGDISVIEATAGWQPIGLAGEYMNTLAFSPDYAADHTIFAGSNGTGVHRSVDGGATWAASNAGLGNLAVYALAVSPNYRADHLVLAGTFEGLYRSTDSGQTWKAPWSWKGYVLEVDPERNQGIKSITFAPSFTTHPVILTVSDDGILVSADSGDTWEAIDPPLSGNLLAYSPTAATDHTLFTANSSGVYRYISGQTEWEAVSNGLRDPVIYALAVSPSYADDRTLFVGTNGGVYRSIDGGESWKMSSTGIGVQHIVSLALSPNYAADRTLFANVAGISYRSADGGDSWAATKVGMAGIMIEALAISPNYQYDRTIFAATQGYGIYRSTDGAGPAEVVPVDAQPASIDQCTSSSPVTLTQPGLALDAYAISEPREVLHDAYNAIFSWLPDGKRLLIARQATKDSPQATLETLNLESGATRRYADWLSIHGPAPVWLDEPQAVAFIQWTLDQGKLLQVSYGDERPVETLPVQLAAETLGVDPAGRSIALFQRGKGVQPVFVDLSGAITRFPTIHLRPETEKDAGTGYDPRWAPKSGWLALYNETGMYLVDTATGHACEIFLGLSQDYPSKLWALDARWSPDERYLAIQTVSGELGSLYTAGVTVVDTLTGEQRLISTKYSVRDMVWSPDSQTLAAFLTVVPPVPQTDNPIWDGLFLLDARSGELRRILPERQFVPLYLRQLAWSPDGQTLAYTCPSDVAGSLCLSTVKQR
jgi:photosystem II stability/assembly factor-like uncharacterized protein